MRQDLFVRGFSKVSKVVGLNITGFTCYGLGLYASQHEVCGGANGWLIERLSDEMSVIPHKSSPIWNLSRLLRRD